MAGKRIVFSCGNHDHHIVVRDLRTAGELKVIAGDDVALAEGLAMQRNFFQRFLDRRLPGVESVIAYPTYQLGDVLCCHGHYLDAHMTGSLADRLLTGAIWQVAGGRPSHALTTEDYEAIIVPLTELLFTVAQLPRGTAAQQAMLHQLRRIGKLIELAGAPRRELRRLRSRVPVRSGAPLADGGIARPCSVIDPPSNALRAYGQVVRNLGWDKLATKMIFSHTHQPLNGARDEACGDIRFWNTGSWIHEPRIESQGSWERYLDLGWPGTAVLIDTARGHPGLVELLRDENPREHVSSGSVPRPLGPSYEEAVRSRALAA